MFLLTHLLYTLNLHYPQVFFSRCQFPFLYVALSPLNNSVRASISVNVYTDSERLCLAAILLASCSCADDRTAGSEDSDGLNECWLD